MMSSIKGIRFNVSYFTDMTASQMLSHANDIIDIYSNSWGPSDSGSIAGGPGMLTKMTLRNAAMQVSAICRSTIKLCYSDKIVSHNIIPIRQASHYFFIRQQMNPINLYSHLDLLARTY